MHQPMEEEEEEPEEDLPPYQPFEDVSLLTYPLQSAPGSSSNHPPIWDQILNNQISMQGKLNVLERHQQNLNRHQRRMEYKLDKYFAQSGLSIDSPPTTPTDDKRSFSILSLIFLFHTLGTMHVFKCGGRHRNEYDRYIIGILVY